MKRDCGACSACCTLIGVPDIGKPRLMRCWDTTVHGGCNRHHEKDTVPELQSCKVFQCVWLQSQSMPGQEWIRAARPDICHVVFGPPDPTDDMRLFVHVDPAHPTAWKKDLIQNHLSEMAERGVKIRVYVGDMVIEGDALGLD